MDIWKRETNVEEYNYQIYIALIYRFIKIDSHIIDQNKIKNVFFKLTEIAAARDYSFLKILSPTAMITLL